MWFHGNGRIQQLKYFIFNKKKQIREGMQQRCNPNKHL